MVELEVEDGSREGVKPRRDWKKVGSLKGDSELD
jgi:hypothetical protein